MVEGKKTQEFSMESSGFVLMGPPPRDDSEYILYVYLPHEFPDDVLFSCPENARHSHVFLLKVSC